MRRKNTEQLDSILARYLRNEGLETPLNEYRLVNAWSEVMGAAVACYTGKVYIYNRTLYVELLSPALRSNLFMRRVCAALNLCAASTLMSTPMSFPT